MITDVYCSSQDIGLQNVHELTKISVMKIKGYKVCEKLGASEQQIRTGRSHATVLCDLK